MKTASIFYYLVDSGYYVVWETQEKNYVVLETHKEQ